MTRFQKLALLTAIATYVLVVIGAVSCASPVPAWAAPTGRSATARSSRRSATRRPGSSGSIAPWRRVVGFLVAGVWSSAACDPIGAAPIVLAATAAVVFTGFQAYLGKITVETGNSGESVTAHLATAMSCSPRSSFIAVRARYPADLPSRGAAQRFTLLAIFRCDLGLRADALRIASHRDCVRSRSSTDWPLFRTARSSRSSTATRTVAASRCRQLPASHRRRRRWSHRPGDGLVAWRRAGDGRWGAVAARAHAPRPGRHRGGALRRPGHRRRAPDLDDTRAVGGRAPPRARGRHLVAARRRP